MDGWMDGWMGVKPGLRDCLAKSKTFIFLSTFLENSLANSGNVWTALLQTMPGFYNLACFGKALFQILETI
jgi:hypothetical protein